MKANAPEKLYLGRNIYSTYLYQVPDPDDDTAVEYTKTEAFIDKACDWLEQTLEPYIPYCVIDIDLAIKGFKKYMEYE